MKSNISLGIKTALLSTAIALVAACSGMPADSTSDSAPAVESAEESESAESESAETETMTEAEEIADSEMMTETESSDDSEAGDSAEMSAMENTKLNLNEASGDEFLAAIPDFSDRMVHEFEEYRPYISIQQFRQEMGKYVDDETIAGYEEYVYVPVDVNESDAETLMQIPGVDESVANTLIASRPFGSNDRFLDALAGQISPDGAIAAIGYLAE